MLYQKRNFKRGLPLDHPKPSSVSIFVSITGCGTRLCSTAREMVLCSNRIASPYLVSVHELVKR